MKVAGSSTQAFGGQRNTHCIYCSQSSLSDRRVQTCNLGYGMEASTSTQPGQWGWFSFVHIFTETLLR